MKRQQVLQPSPLQPGSHLASCASCTLGWAPLPLPWGAWGVPHWRPLGILDGGIPELSPRRCWPHGLDLSRELLGVGTTPIPGLSFQDAPVTFQTLRCQSWTGAVTRRAEGTLNLTRSLRCTWVACRLCLSGPSGGGSDCPLEALCHLPAPSAIHGISSSNLHDPV